MLSCWTGHEQFHTVAMTLVWLQHQCMSASSISSIDHAKLNAVACFHRRYAWSLDTYVEYAWTNLLKMSVLLLAMLVLEVRGWEVVSLDGGMLCFGQAYLMQVTMDLGNFVYGHIHQRCSQMCTMVNRYNATQ